MVTGAGFEVEQPTSVNATTILATPVFSGIAGIFVLLVDAIEEGRLLHLAARLIGEAVTFLVSERNAPFSKVRLTTLMRKWCDDAGLPHCTMHGLRKAAATVAAENGATDDELMAIFGWTTKQQTALYTRNASRRKLAGRAMSKIVRNEESTEDVPPDNGDLESGAKVAKKP